MIIDLIIILLFIYYMYIYIIIFLLIIFCIFLLSKNKDLFTVESKVQGNIYPDPKTNKLDNYDFFDNHIYIGKYNDEEILQQYHAMKNNEDLKNISNKVINIKNILFVKDNIKIGNDADNIELNINEIRRIKNGPNLFDGTNSETNTSTKSSTNNQKQICLKNYFNEIACIEQKHIEMLNGNRAMIINTFTDLYPFVFFTEKDYKGWKISGVGLNKNNDSSCKSCEQGKTLYFKSVKIQEGFKLTAFSEVNGPKGESFQNTIILEGDTPDVEAVGGALFKDGIKSYWPETTFGKTDIKDRLCLTSYKFGPWQQRIGESQNIITNIFTAKPCSFGKEQEFRINKKKLYYDNNDSNVRIHRHKLGETHEDI